MQRNFHFDGVNRGALWAKLDLSTAQVAALCDVTTRQVSYWAHKGLVPRSAHNPERFSGSAVDMCVLIRQALDAGASLAQAGELAATHTRAESQLQPRLSAFEPPVVLDFYEKLAGVEATMRLLRQVLVPHLPLAQAPDGARHNEADGGPGNGAAEGLLATAGRDLSLPS